MEAPDEWAVAVQPVDLALPASCSLVMYARAVAGAADRAVAGPLGRARPHARRTEPGGRRRGRSSRSSAARPHTAQRPEPGYDADLRAVKDLARQEPRVVANVVKDWVGQ